MEKENGNSKPKVTGIKTQVTAPALHNYSDGVEDTDHMKHKSKSKDSIVPKANGHDPAGRGNAEAGTEEDKGFKSERSNEEDVA